MSWKSAHRLGTVDGISQELVFEARAALVRLWGAGDEKVKPGNFGTVLTSIPPEELRREMESNWTESRTLKEYALALCAQG